MLKKTMSLVLAGFLLIGLCGCAALLIGAAGGAGTAFWLEGKIRQELNAPLSKVVSAADSALKAMHLSITKTTLKDDVAQIMGEYTDGRTIWIDVHWLSEQSSRIEIRVGAKGDKEASRKILNKVQRYL